MSCFTQTELRNYLMQESATAMQSGVEQHLATCAHCCQTLESLASDDMVDAFFDAARRDAQESDPVFGQFEGSTDATVGDFPEWQPLEAAGPGLPLRFDRFVLRKVIGSGGFGVVYHADDINLKRDVAVKIPHLGGLSAEVRRRFLQEGKAAANLHHPHIVPVHQSGTHRGVCFLVSEYCPGQTLRQWLDTRCEEVRIRDAAVLVMQLAKAADHAHKNGIVHRDIKPANVILDERSAQDGFPFCPRLTDFGTARFLEAARSVTLSGTLIGTVPYMAPEQIRGRNVGPACDIYSLGVLLFELLSGQLPISGVNNVETIQRVLHSEVPAAHQLRSELPRDVSAICSCCLEKSPDRRYASARELADDLRRFLNNEPTHARPLRIGARLFRWSQRNPLPLTIMTTVCLVFLLILGGLAWYNHRLAELNLDLVAANHHALDMKDRAEQSEHHTRRLIYASDIRLAADHWRDGDTKTVYDILQRYESSQDGPDLRGLEWKFLKQAVQPAFDSLATVGSPLYCMRFSPDGRRFATSGQDGVIRIYGRQGGVPEQVIESGQREVNSVTFAPDGQTLASAGDDGSVCLWRLADGEQLKRFVAHDGLAFGVEFTPEGDLLATCGTDGLVQLWKDGKKEHTYRDHSARVEAIAISPNGRWLASVGKDRTLAVQDIKTGVLLFNWDRAAGTLSSVAFSPDSNNLAVVEAAGDTTSLVLFDLPSGRLLCARQHSGGIRSVAFATTGDRILTTDSAGAARLWSVSRANGRLTVSEEPLVTWQAHETRAEGGVFEPGGRSVLTIGSDGQVRRYSGPQLADEIVLDAVQLEKQYRLETLKIHEVAFLGQTHKLLASAHFGVAVVDSDGRESPSLVQFPPTNEWSCIASPRNANWFVVAGSTPWQETANGRRVSAVVERVEVPTGRKHRIWETDRNCSIIHLTCSSDGKLVTAVINDQLVKGQSKELLLIVADSGELVTKLPAAVGTRPAFTLDGRMMVYGVQRDIFLYDLRTRQQQVIREAHTDSQCGLALSNDGRWMATCDEGRIVKIWNLTTLNQHTVLQGHQSKVSALVFSADCRTLLSSSFDGTVKAWSVLSGQPLMDLHVDTAGVSHMALSSDSRQLAVVEDKTRVRIYRIGQ
jgi:eukaryotic-like serine/threonine-protein kinase